METLDKLRDKAAQLLQRATERMKKEEKQAREALQELREFTEKLPTMTRGQLEEAENITATDEAAAELQKLPPLELAEKLEKMTQQLKERAQKLDKRAKKKAKETRKSEGKS